MTILATGAAGFIGSNVVHTLVRQGHTVIALDHFKVGTPDRLKGFSGTIIQADICTFNWESVKEGLDGVIHEAAITDTTITDERLMLAVNTEAFARLLDFAKRAKIRVVYASSAGVYGNGEVPMRETNPMTPENIYGVSKMKMDELTKVYMREHPDLRIVGLRYFNVYGPGEQHKGNAASMMWQLSLQMKAGKRPRIFKYGEQKRDFVYVKDVATATIAGLSAKTSGVVNVGSGKTETFNRVIEVLNKVLGYSYQAEYFDNPYSFYQNETLADISAAGALLGYQPAYTLDTGIADYFSNQESEVRSQK